MIYVIIGQCGAGKTTFVRNLITEPYKIMDNFPMACTATNNFIALGKYHIGRRAEGADYSFFRTNADSVIETLKVLLEKGYKNILLEGQRVNSDKIFSFLASLNIPVRLILLTCSIGTSIERLRDTKISEDFIKQTKINALYSYLKWSRIFNWRFFGAKLA